MGTSVYQRKAKKNSYGGVLSASELRAINGIARSKKDNENVRRTLQDAFDMVGGLDASVLFEKLEGVEGVTLDDVLALRIQRYYIEHPGEANILALSKVRGEQVKRECELTISFKPHEYFGSITKENGASNVIELTEAEVKEPVLEEVE